MEDKHSGKMIAPIIIASIMILYYLGFFVSCMLLPMPGVLKLVLVLLPILLAGVCIFVLVERIGEIRSGEEDDLSNY